MAIETINLGTHANDGTGDDLRTAFQKVNSNFAEINTTYVTGGANLGAGAGLFASKSATNLQFKSVVAGLNVTVASDGTTITINAPNVLHSLEEDTAPKLGADLDTDGHAISGVRIIGTTTKTIRSEAGTAIELLGDTDVKITASVGDIVMTGPVFALDGITGNVTGTVSSIANHNLRDLGDVSDANPAAGQALVWSGAQWVATTVVTGSGTSLDFGSFDAPVGFTLDMGPF